MLCHLHLTQTNIKYITELQKMLYSKLKQQQQQTASFLTTLWWYSSMDICRISLSKGCRQQWWWRPAETLWPPGTWPIPLCDPDVWHGSTALCSRAEAVFLHLLKKLLLTTVDFLLFVSVSVSELLHRKNSKNKRGLGVCIVENIFHKRSKSMLYWGHIYGSTDNWYHETMCQCIPSSPPHNFHFILNCNPLPLIRTAAVIKLFNTADN